MRAKENLDLCFRTHFNIEIANKKSKTVFNHPIPHVYEYRISKIKSIILYMQTLCTHTFYVYLPYPNIDASAKFISH